MYIDKTAGHFSGDFTHKFEVQYSDRSGSSVGGVFFWVLANAIDSYGGLVNANEDLVAFNIGKTDVFRIWIVEDGETSFDVSAETLRLGSARSRSSSCELKPL